MRTDTSSPSLRITVWNEGVHEATQPEVAVVYPDGIHGAIAEGLRLHLGDDATIRTAVLSDPEHGLSEAVMEETDVLLWWGHVAHENVENQVVERVRRHVLGGMGLIVLHSGHFSKIFTSLMGTTCSLLWRNEAEREIVWNVDPSHPIATDVCTPLVLDEQETYGEYFDIPTPEELVFISSFSGGEVFRSGVTFKRGRGKIFYFSPGDQLYPVYYRSDIRKILANASQWAASSPSTQRALPSVANPPQGWYLNS